MADPRNNLLQSKKKFRVVIRDHFSDDDVDLGDILAQLDPTEKNEVDIQNAVHEKDRVAVPEFEVVPGSKALSLRSGTTFKAPVRCFNYDSDYFEPVTYFADEQDMKFIEKFNREHKFLKMSTVDLERVFVVCEEIVRDSASEVPTFEQVMLNLGLEAPPYPVCEAIFKHWEGREKLCGSSVIRALEFPPNHQQLRQHTIKTFRDMNKSRKNMKPVDYLKRLFQDLVALNEERKRAVELLEQQEKKRIDSERFVREKMRQLGARMPANAHKLVLETPIEPHEKAVPGKAIEDPNVSMLPDPPGSALFLRWCMKKKV